ncbi:hypothetical protein, partial [Georgenia thermotolerans]
MTGRLTAALDARIAALDAAAAPEPPADPDALPQAERRLKRRWLVALALLLLGVVITAVYLGGRPTAAGATRAITLTLSVPLVLAVSAQHGYYRALRRHAWTAATADEARHARAEAADDARRERARLGLMREALTDWCEIVGHLVHRPWAPIEVPAPEPPADLLATLPAAVALGLVAGRDAAAHERAVHATLAALCHPGWCAESFDELVAALDDGGRRSPGGYLAADLDVRGGPFAPRRRLVEACRAGRGGALA